MTRQGNFFKIYDAMVDIDADLWGYLTRIAHMCKSAYTDIFIEAGKELDPHEEELRLVAKQMADDLDFKGEFFSIAFDLMKHGDVIKHLVWDVENGVTKLQTLPRFDTTAVETKSQIGDFSQQIFEANIFVVNEQNSNKMTSFEADKCIQFALNNKSTHVRDIVGRETFGVWSQSPINTLLWYLEWKVNTMINDILWGHRNVPREWHKLDLSMFSPDKYQGTREEKERQALRAAQTAANQYAVQLQARQVDVGLVTDKLTEVEYLEPKSTNYQQPNLKIAQINEAISNAIGLPPVARDTTYASSLMSGSFAILQALSIAEIIKTGLEVVLRKSIKVKHGEKYPDELLEKLRVRLRLILEKDKSEIMRQIAVMVESRLFTPTEIRAEWGLLSLTENQKMEIAEMVPMGKSGKETTTTEEVIEDFKKTKRGGEWPEYDSEKGTPQKRIPK